jgi:hypothetical protein
MIQEAEADALFEQRLDREVVKLEQHPTPSSAAHICMRTDLDAREHTDTAADGQLRAGRKSNGYQMKERK